MKKLVILASILLLAGCVSAEQQARYDAAQMQADTAECQRLGFKAGTEGMSNCILKLREIRVQEENTDELRRANMPDPWGPWGPWGPYRRW